MINYWSAQCQYLDWISSAVSSGRSSFVMHIVATLFALPRPLQGMCFDVCRPWHSEVLVLRSLSSVDCRVMEGKVCWSEWTKIERSDRSRYIIRNIYVLANYFSRLELIRIPELCLKHETKIYTIRPCSYLKTGSQKCLFLKFACCENMRFVWSQSHLKGHQARILEATVPCRIFMSWFCLGWMKSQPLTNGMTPLIQLYT